VNRILLGLFIVGCLSTTAICEDGWEVSYLKKIKGLMYSPTESNPYSGDIFDLNDQGVVTMRGSYYKGLRDEQWDYYDVHGEINKIEIYQSGQVRMSREYNGIDNYGTPFKHGHDIDYYANGNRRVLKTYRKNVLHGEYLEGHENGQSSVAGHYNNGDRVGTWTEWYVTGRKKLVETYSNDLLQGDCKKYHRNGKLKSSGKYKNGKEHGVWTAWDEAGGKTGSVEFKNGMLWGRLISYHWNGKVESSGNYSNGELEGVFENYYSNGQMHVKAKFLGGYEEGLATQWYRDGSKKREGKFVQGKENGTWSYWDSTKSGVLSEQHIYEKGKLRSKSTYHDTGKIKSEADYFGIKKNGKYILWYDNGQIEERGEYRDDVMHGQWAYWYDSGQKKKEYSNINGVGLVTTYYSNGTKESEGLQENIPERFEMGYKCTFNEGKWTYWYENGQKEREEIHSEDSRPYETDFEKEWYPNGNKKQDYALDNDSNEVIYTWYENGQLKSKVICGSPEKPVSSYDEWYSNGWKKSEGKYFIGYYASGTIAQRGGEWSFWSLNGSEQTVYFKARVPYDDRFNSQTGVFTEMAISGEIKEQGKVVESTQYPGDYVKDGRWVELNENGQQIVILYNEGTVIK
jgi:antitoxin component YwqK of YwqJK toxin-antitoxin module